VDDRVERWRTLCDIRNKTFRSIVEGKRTFGGLKAYLRATNHTSSNIISRNCGKRCPPWGHPCDIYMRHTTSIQGDRGNWVSIQISSLPT
jgi:hypothetical protein